MFDPPVAGRERSIAVGGLMRCCTGTIRQMEKLTAVGDTEKCEYCSSTFTVSKEDMAWHWDGPRSGEES